MSHGYPTPPPQRRGLTLVETVVSIFLFSLISIVSVQAVMAARLLERQAFERHLALSFLQDYTEQVLSLRFKDIVLTNARVITLPDQIRTLPDSYNANTWISTNPDDNPNEVLGFPELQYLVKNGIWPDYQVEIVNVDDTLNGTGTTDYKILRLRIRWAGASYFRNNADRSTLELESRSYNPFEVDYLRQEGINP